jgi:hypothetical protein
MFRLAIAPVASDGRRVTMTGPPHDGAAVARRVSVGPHVEIPEGQGGKLRPSGQSGCGTSGVTSTRDR